MMRLINFMIENMICMKSKTISNDQELILSDPISCPQNRKGNAAALLTRWYIQHALRPYIDSEINHIRYFIKIPFINKGIEFIALPSIFRDNTVVSSIASYFKNTESHIICYKYE